MLVSGCARDVGRRVDAAIHGSVSASSVTCVLLCVCVCCAQVHGTLERKHHPIHRPSVESNDPAKAGGGSGWATTKSAGTAKYNSHNTIPKLSGGRDLEACLRAR